MAFDGIHLLPLLAAQEPLPPSAAAAPTWTRAQRLQEFFRRLRLEPACASAQGAFECVEAVLNAVENELSGLPYDPCHPRHDGRLYPAKSGYRCRMAARPDLRRYRFKAHILYIGPSGAILIEHKEHGPVLCKPGRDGTTVEL